MQQLFYLLQLSFVIIAINQEGKVDVASNVYNQIGYELLIEALLQATARLLGNKQKLLMLYVTFPPSYTCPGTLYSKQRFAASSSYSKRGPIRPQPLQSCCANTRSNLGDSLRPFSISFKLERTFKTKPLSQSSYKCNKLVKE